MSHGNNEWSTYHSRAWLRRNGRDGRQNRKRQYTTCASCGEWVYNWRLASVGHTCSCGQKFPGAKKDGSLTPATAEDQQAKRMVAQAQGLLERAAARGEDTAKHQAALDAARMLCLEEKPQAPADSTQLVEAIQTHARADKALGAAISQVHTLNLKIDAAKEKVNRLAAEVLAAERKVAELNVKRYPPQIHIEEINEPTQSDSVFKRILTQEVDTISPADFGLDCEVGEDLDEEAAKLAKEETAKLLVSIKAQTATFVQQLRDFAATTRDQANARAQEIRTGAKKRKAEKATIIIERADDPMTDDSMSHSSAPASSTTSASAPAKAAGKINAEELDKKKTEALEAARKAEEKAKSNE